MLCSIHIYLHFLIGKLINHIKHNTQIRIIFFINEIGFEILRVHLLIDEYLHQIQSCLYIAKRKPSSLTTIQS